MKTLAVALLIFLSTSISAEETTKSTGDFLKEIDLPTSMTTNKAFALTFAQAKSHLAQFPAMDSVEIPNDDEALRLCKKAGFQGIFYWSTCVRDLSGKILSERALRAGVQIARSSNYGPLAETMRAVANQYLDGSAFDAILPSIAPEYLSGLLIVMAGAQFESDLVVSCNPRSNPVGNIIHPLSNSRTLNQKNILQCLYTIRDVKLDTLAEKAQFARCRIYPDIVSKTECFRLAFKTAK